MRALTFHRVTVRYGDLLAIAGVSGAVAQGTLTAIAGPNGAGKSTLLKSIAGLLEPDAGVIDLSGCGPGDIAYLPQKAAIESRFPITVCDVVAAGLWHRYGAFRRITANALAEIDHALCAVGLRGFESRTIGSLSSGQLQRVLFARLMLQDAKLILLDEPFSAVDAKTTADLIDLIKRWHAERRTVLCALHDLEQVRAHFPSTLLLARTVVAWGDTNIALSPSNLLRARAMLEACDPPAPLSKAWA
jgi:zinc/manganese transport system ATP-binding protein